MKPLSAILTFVILTASHAQAGEPSPREIVLRTTERNALGFETGVASVRVILRDKDGAEQTQKVMSLARMDDGVRSILVRYETPADVRGTKFLLIDRPEPQDDDMFLFLPELKRTRRITGAQRNGAFMGSDFSYADMQGLDLKEASYERKPDRRVGDVDCYVVNVVPKRKDSEYKQIVLTVRKDNFMPATSEYFGPDNALVKAFKTYEIKKIDGVWIITKSQMWNKKTGHSSVVVVDEARPNEKVEPSSFHPQTFAQQ